MTKQKGFTLIELLVVIFIISILTGIGLVSFSGAQKQARDTTRRSDLGQYRNAIENYAANNNALYPNHQSGQDADGMCSSSLQPYMSSCPSDPISTQEYRYYSNAAFSSTKYMLFATLESGTSWWYICSDGRTGKLGSIPVPATCGF